MYRCAQDFRQNLAVLAENDKGGCRISIDSLSFSGNSDGSYDASPAGYHTRTGRPGKADERHRAERGGDEHQPSFCTGIGRLPHRRIGHSDGLSGDYRALRWRADSGKHAASY